MVRPLAFALLVLAAVGCSTSTDEDLGDGEGAASAAKVSGITAAERAKYLETGKIFDEQAFDERRSMAEDAMLAALLDGPENPLGLGFNTEVICTFHDLKDASDKPGGKSPKFDCDMPDQQGKNVKAKVKYSGKGRPMSEPPPEKDSDDNNEIYAEIISTRLQWALGYAVDAVYPVRVTCLNCPEDPWAEIGNFPNDTPETAKTPRATRRFHYAAIEIKHGPKVEEFVKMKDGKEITKQDQGWSWEEVEKLRGGHKDVEWDVLRLLAAFMAHVDNKAENQRLECEPEGIGKDGKCSKPLLVVQDVGESFGGLGGFLGLSDQAVNISKWSVPFWKDQSTCQARLDIGFHKLAGASLSDPIVTDEARDRLATRMNKLTQAQIETIFKASRIEERKDHKSVTDWFNAFDAKRRELSSTCGEK
jgi:hypothetical protein